MKQFLTIFMLTCCSLCQLGAFEMSGGDLLVEGRVGYFYPNDSRFRDIYGKGFLYSLEATWESSCRFDPWMSVGYFHRDGRSYYKGAKEVNCPLQRHHTDITLVPFGLGVKKFFCWSCVRPYVGAGLAVQYIHTNDHDSDVCHQHVAWDAGAVLKLGALYDITDCFFFDLFLDYTWLKGDFHYNKRETVKHRNVQMSGPVFGGGLGYRF